MSSSSKSSTEAGSTMDQQDNESGDSKRKGTKRLTPEGILAVASNMRSTVLLAPPDLAADLNINENQVSSSDDERELDGGSSPPALIPVDIGYMSVTSTELANSTPPVLIPTQSSSNAIKQDTCSYTTEKLSIASVTGSKVSSAQSYLSSSLNVAPMDSQQSSSIKSLILLKQRQVKLSKGLLSSEPHSMSQLLAEPGPVMNKDNLNLQQSQQTLKDSSKEKNQGQGKNYKKDKKEDDVQEGVATHAQGQSNEPAKVDTKGKKEKIGRSRQNPSPDITDFPPSIIKPASGGSISPQFPVEVEFFDSDPRKQCGNYMAEDEKAPLRRITSQHTVQSQRNHENHETENGEPTLKLKGEDEAVSLESQDIMIEPPGSPVRPVLADNKEDDKDSSKSELTNEKGEAETDETNGITSSDSGATLTISSGSESTDKKPRRPRRKKAKLATSSDNAKEEISEQECGPSSTSTSQIVVPGSESIAKKSRRSRRNKAKQAASSNVAEEKSSEQGCDPSGSLGSQMISLGSESIVKESRRSRRKKAKQAASSKNAEGKNSEPECDPSGSSDSQLVSPGSESTAKESRRSRRQKARQAALVNNAKEENTKLNEDNSSLAREPHLLPVPSTSSSHPERKKLQKRGYSVSAGSGKLLLRKESHSVPTVSGIPTDESNMLVPVLSFGPGPSLGSVTYSVKKSKLNISSILSDGNKQSKTVVSKKKKNKVADKDGQAQPKDEDVYYDGDSKREDKEPEPWPSSSSSSSAQKVTGDGSNLLLNTAIEYWSDALSRSGFYSEEEQNALYQHNRYIIRKRDINTKTSMPIKKFYDVFRIVFVPSHAPLYLLQRYGAIEDVNEDNDNEDEFESYYTKVYHRATTDGLWVKMDSEFYQKYMPIFYGIVLGDYEAPNTVHVMWRDKVFSSLTTLFELNPYYGSFQNLTRILMEQVLLGDRIENLLKEEDDHLGKRSWTFLTKLIDDLIDEIFGHERWNQETVALLKTWPRITKSIKDLDKGKDCDGCQTKFERTIIKRINFSGVPYDPVLHKELEVVPVTKKTIQCCYLCMDIISLVHPLIHLKRMVEHCLTYKAIARTQADPTLFEEIVKLRDLIIDADGGHWMRGLYLDFCIIIAEGRKGLQKLQREKSIWEKRQAKAKAKS